MNATLEQVSKWADWGWTQHDAAQALDLTYEKFRAWLRMQEGFTWPKGRTIGQQRYHASKQPKGNPARGKALNAASVAARPHYTVRGVTGTVRQLAAHFQVVSYAAVLKRMHNGQSVEDALLKPAHKGRRDQLLGY